ncbi:MAG: DUF938 domain-containing protein [Hyphomonadaceae bacterium]
MSDAARASAPSTARNREPILAVLRAHLPTRGRVLEIASGAGEHAVYFAAAMPGLAWQPSDPDEAARASIAAWIAHEGSANVAAPLAIDVTAPDWRVDGPFDALVAINMIHIAPWAATEGLMAGAARVLAPGSGVLFLYGPFIVDGLQAAPSNEAFDASLRARNPEWGVRNLNDVKLEAAKHGLALRTVAEMPANNLAVIFSKT